VYPAIKTIKYDFKTQNVLTFKYQWDNTFPYGYTAWSGYYTVKNWYSQWQTLWTLPNEAYVNDVKKVTLKGSAQSAICSLVMISWNWWNANVVWVRWWVSSWWPSQWSYVYVKADWQGQGSLVYPATFPTWDFDFELDLDGWKFKCWQYEASLSSDFISAFKIAWASGEMRIGITNWNYNAWSNNYYTYLKECIIEY